MSIIFGPPYLYVLALLYFPLVTRLLFFFIHDGFFGLRQLNRLAGRAELYLGWVRDYVMIPIALYFFVLRLYGIAKLGAPLSLPAELPFVFLSLYSRWWRWHGLKPLQEFARLNPRAHPTEFFQHLYGRLGFLPHRVPLRAMKRIDPAHLRFRENKRTKQSFWILLCGAYDTFIFATLAYKAFKWKGAHYIRTAGSGLSLVWASRLAQLARMDVKVERSPALEQIKGGKRIYAVNHKSFFDFCLAPLAYLQENSDGSAAGFTPRIMVAKDHFKDNFFLYRVLGFGRMLEAWGMVFVDRKSKRDEGRARAAVEQAAKQLISSDMSFSIYPQGTRASGQHDRNGARWDAGYFCVGNKRRLIKDGGHFKKGIAYVTVETALSLLKHQLAGPVWVIPVGMNGIGTACPSGALKVQTETDVVIKLGEPICLTLESIEKFRTVPYRDIVETSEYRELVQRTARQVDTSLQQLLDVPKRLERRFFIDLNDILDSGGVGEVSIAFKEWRAEGELIYVILDCIYALPMQLWRGFLSELAHILRQECTRRDLTQLRNKIAESF